MQTSKPRSLRTFLIVKQDVDVVPLGDGIVEDNRGSYAHSVVAIDSQDGLSTSFRKSRDDGFLQGLFAGPRVQSVHNDVIDLV
jgi:hypothetical protein